MPSFYFFIFEVKIMADTIKNTFSVTANIRVVNEENDSDVVSNSSGEVIYNSHTKHLLIGGENSRASQIAEGLILPTFKPYPKEGEAIDTTAIYFTTSLDKDTNTITVNAVQLDESGNIVNKPLASQNITEEYIVNNYIDIVKMRNEIVAVGDMKDSYESSIQQSIFNANSSANSAIAAASNAEKIYETVENYLNNTLEPQVTDNKILNGDLAAAIAKANAIGDIDTRVKDLEAIDVNDEDDTGKTAWSNKKIKEHIDSEKDNLTYSQVSKPYGTYKLEWSAKDNITGFATKADESILKGAEAEIGKETAVTNNDSLIFRCISATKGVFKLTLDLLDEEKATISTITLTSGAANTEYVYKIYQEGGIWFIDLNGTKSSMTFNKNKIAYYKLLAKNTGSKAKISSYYSTIELYALQS